MSEISRSDLYIASGKTADWLDGFLRTLANSKPASVQDILQSIYNRRSETVESVVEDYRKQTGLDILKSSEEDSDFKPISARHMEEQSIVKKIENDPQLKAEIDSFCKHSGGTKNVESLLNFLRGRLGSDVSFADDDLRNYLNKRKEYFKENVTPEVNSEVGQVGIDSNVNNEDDVADYMMYDGKK